MPVDAQRFREALASFATGVAVVTTRTGEGLHGFTVNAFCPVAAAPPLVLVCVDRLARGAALIEEAGAFGVSILGARQMFLADRFAGRGPLVNRQFGGAPYFVTATGAPLLRGALAWLDCAVAERHTAGDHELYLGLVLAAGEGDPEARPLVYWNRAYRALLA